MSGFTGVGRQPHYITLTNSLLRDIQSGKYPVGSLLPPELEIVEQFGLSRHTVREAIRRLKEMGLVTRQHGIGTRVKARDATSRYIHKVSSIGDLLQYAKEVRLKVESIGECVADDELAERLKCKPKQRWLNITGVRYENKTNGPICFTSVYVNYAFSGIRDMIGKSDVPIYMLIAQQYGEQIKEIEQQIGAVAIVGPTAKILGVPVKSPGLSITRHYFSDLDKVVEVSFNTYPADRFSYSMRLGLEMWTEGG